VIGAKRLFLSLTVKQKEAALIIFCHLYVTGLVHGEKLTLSEFEQSISLWYKSKNHRLGSL